MLCKPVTVTAALFSLLAAALGPPGARAIDSSADGADESDADPDVRARVKAEPQLLVVDAARGRMRLWEGGRLVVDLRVALGEVAGCKEVRGDHKTPCGTYHVVDKLRPSTKGPSAMFGGYWMRLNYPNADDAARGAELISPDQQTAIRQAWRHRRSTPQDTALGGGVGIHGWSEDWQPPPDDVDRFSWGCVVVRPADMAALYDRVRVGTTVILR